MCRKEEAKKMLRRYEITVSVLRENWPLCCRTTQHSTDIPRSLDKLIRTNLFLPDVMWMLQGTGGFVARKDDEEMARNGEGKKMEFLPVFTFIFSFYRFSVFFFSLIQHLRNYFSFIFRFFSSSSFVEWIKKWFFDKNGEERIPEFKKAETPQPKTPGILWR